MLLLRGGFLSSFVIPLPRLGWGGGGRRVFCSVSCSNSRIASSFWEHMPIPCHRWNSIEVYCKHSSQNIQHSTNSESQISRLPDLAFDRLQLNDEKLLKGHKRPFSRYVARGAVLDEEYWTAAWLRAEAHWEAISYMRHANSFKRKYAEQEFYALKRRCSGRDGNSLKCFCIVTVKKEDPNVKRTVLNSVVGTLDVSIRQLVQGETFPGESKRITPVLVPYDACDAHRYVYIANICVSKFARRQGIATNMLHLASDIAISSGVKQLFIHVSADNKPAQDLYSKFGFETVEAASSPLSTDQNLLMWMEL